MTPGKAVGARPHSEASAIFAQRAASRLQLTSDQRKSSILLVDHHITFRTWRSNEISTIPRPRWNSRGMVRDPDESRRADAAHPGRRPGDQRGRVVGLEGVARLAVCITPLRSICPTRRRFYEARKIERESLQEAVAAKLAPDYAEEIDAHFDFMPDNYFRAFGVREIASHAALFRRFWRTSTCATSLPWLRRSNGKRFRSRVTARRRFAPGTVSNCWRKSPAHSPSCRSTS